MADEDYRGQHEAPGPGYGMPLHDTTDVYPKDFYGPNGFRYYADQGSDYDRNSYNTAVRLNGKPEEPVWIHRAVPLDVYKKAMKTDAPLSHLIKKGDWVTPSKEYAREHGEGPLGGKYKVVGKRVRAKDVFTNGDSIHEWGYHPADKADGGIVGDPNTDEGITAYHGSPHDFERFDMSKIGTGEGAQAYGHGLYFAENEPVAKGYRDKLSEGTYKTDTGEIFDPYKNLEHMNVRVAAYKGIDPAIERAQGILQSDPHDDRVRRYLKKLYALKDKNAAPHKGHMYEVHINAHPDHFLDWDKPISEQSEHVQKAIKHIAGQLDIDPFEHLALAAVVGQHPRSQTYSPRGEDLHTDIDEILGGKEHASEALHAAGIKGIRYLDAGSRPDGAYALHISHKGIPYTDPIPMKTFQQAQNHAKEYAAKGYDTEIKENGSRNYVVFDDKLVSVKRKYAQGGDVGTTRYHFADGGTPTDIDPITGKPIVKKPEAGDTSSTGGGGGTGPSVGGAVDGYKDGGKVSYKLKPDDDDRKHAGYKDDGGKMTWMSPDKFLAQTQKMQMDKEDKKSIKRFEKKIKKGKGLNPLAIYPSGGQDGRHRATAAKHEGITKVPVITWPKKASGGSIVDRALMVTSKKAKASGDAR